MKKIIFLLFFLPSICSATTITTDSVVAIVAAPAGNVVNGYIVESLVGQGNAVLLYNSNSSLVFMGLDAITNSIALVNGVATLRLITDSTEAISTAPAGNAVNGALITSIIAQCNIINPVNGSIALIAVAIDSSFNFIELYNTNLGTYKLEDGYAMEDCEIYNDQLTLVSSPANNVDVIMINGF